MTEPTLFDTDDPPEPPRDAESASAKPQQLIPVWNHSRFSAKCKRCGQPMTMVQVVSSGKWMPFDADPVALRTSLDPATRNVIEHLDAADCHFATCKYAREFRR